MRYRRSLIQSSGYAKTLDPIETVPWSEVQAMQLQLLKTQLQYLNSHSEFYASQFATNNINAEAIDSFEALAAIPFTTKQDLRDSLAENPPFGHHVAVAPDRIVQIQASSGTTGSPAYVALTEHDLLSWQEGTARGMFACGMRPGDRVLHGFSMGKGFVGGIPIFQAIQYLGAADIPVGADGGVDRLLIACRDMKPKCLVGTPNFLLYLADIAHDICGVKAQDLGVERIIVGGEPGGGIPAIREGLENAWGATCCELMGGTDLGCVYWAEDDQHLGMHMVGPDFVLTELIDPETEQPIEWREGAQGELVYTSLQREASPVLRFRSADHVVVTAMEAENGRKGPFIRCFGRTDDMLIVRGINLFPSAVQDLIASMEQETNGVMRVLADFKGHTTQSNLKVLVERAAHLSPIDDKKIAKVIEMRIRNALSVKSEVEIVPTDFFHKPGVQKVALTLRERPENLPSVRIDQG